MTFIQTWTKHLTEQLLNDLRLAGDFELIYDKTDQTVLHELFFMLLAAIDDRDVEAEDAYYYVIKDFLVADHYGMFDTILTDAKKEAEYDEPTA